jgi:hypothetical protein
MPHPRDLEPADWKFAWQKWRNDTGRRSADSVEDLIAIYNHAKTHAGDSLPSPSARPATRPPRPPTRTPLPGAIGGGLPVNQNKDEKADSE